MKNLFSAFKLIALLGAVAILAWSVAPGVAEAQTTVCAYVGHACHVIEGGVTYHHKLVNVF